MNTHYFRNACHRAGVLALVVLAAIVASPASAAEVVSGSIMFVRTELKQDTTPANRSLWLYNIGTGATRELTPAMKNVLDGGGSWSPDGKRIAFERASLHVGRPATYRVYIFDTGSGRIQTLASGDGSFRAPGGARASASLSRRHTGIAAASPSWMQYAARRAISTAHPHRPKSSAFRGPRTAAAYWSKPAITQGSSNPPGAH